MNTIENKYQNNWYSDGRVFFFDIKLTVFKKLQKPLLEIEIYYTALLSSKYGFIEKITHLFTNDLETIQLGITNSSGSFLRGSLRFELKTFKEKKQVIVFGLLSEGDAQKSNRFKGAIFVQNIPVHPVIS